MASIGSQWLKKIVLQRNLPNKQKEDIKSYLTLTQTEAGTSIYKDIKDELIRIYAPKPANSYLKALQRTMVGLPSQLGYQIIADICKKGNKLDGCCCAAAAQAIWSLQLPINIRAHISNMPFTKESYKQVFEAADQVFLSSKQITVAAIGQGEATGLDETLPAFNNQNLPVQVAAVANRGQRGGRGRGNRGGRGGRGANRGAASTGTQVQPKPRGPRHSSMPPEQCCDRHYRHGANAFYCLQPLSCPWVNKVVAKP